MPALICIDLINDIMDDNGKLAAKGYPTFARKHQVLQSLSALQRRFRERELPIIHVRIGFDVNYLTQPKSSPLFGRAEEFQALKLNSWGTEFIEQSRPIQNDLIVEKSRVSAFYGTSLDGTLRTMGAKELFICGVATDLAVSSAARDAHDRDFGVTVVQDCCVSADDRDHEWALLSLGKIAKVKNGFDIELP